MRRMGHTSDQVQSLRSDEYSNPIHHTGGGYPTGTGAAIGYGGSDTTGAFLADIGATTGHCMTDAHFPDIEAGYAGSGTQGQLHRGGGGGGVTDKISEKLPGSHKDDEQRTPAMTAGTYKGGENEKKGIMEKIKEKLRGLHN